MNLTRLLGIPAVLLAAVLTGCAAGVSTDDSGSIAVVEKFFEHLELGEATAAAALTDMDFPEEFVDDDFYAASAAVPTDARIIRTTGYDVGGFSATVEYVLDDPSEPVKLDLTVRELDDELKVSGWRFDSPLRIGPTPAAGVVTVNGQLEYTLAEEGNDLQLLPATYAFTYEDPTELLQLHGQDDTSFTVQVPDLEGVSIFPGFLPEVEPAVRAEVERLHEVCADEGFIGPSCPAELVEAMEFASDSEPVVVEWFRESGPDIFFTDGKYESTSTYLAHSVQLPLDVITSYTGTVTRDASGEVIFTR